MSLQQDAFAPAEAFGTLARPLSREALALCKRAADVAVAILGLLVLACAIPVIALLNRFWNPGSLFFTQVRMGKDCEPFTILKFRTMLPAGATIRGFDDPLEVDRITPFGAFMRRTRIDEIPQLINVLRGEMSIVGPRPDVYEHAVRYLDLVPGYRDRHAVRPGITGLAQTVVGYAEGLDATALKVAADLAYIRDMSFRLEMFVLRKTVGVILFGYGAR